MDTRKLLDSLGYTASANCLREQSLMHAPDYGHVFRRAREGAGLDAVYCVRTPPSETGRATGGLIPVSYVCRADSVEEADRIHRRVWNQNVVPFLIVLAPQGVRVYTGFEHEAGGAGVRCLIESPLGDAATRLAVLSSDSIDSGTVWDALGDRVRPHRRVEWRLLEDLAALERILFQDGLKDSALIHTLIGKLLYLYYLRHRGILSDARLARWGFSWPEVAGRSAKMNSFVRLCTEIDEWLNGSVFPLTQRMTKDIGVAILQRAAGAFAGDTPAGQMHLGFDAYDFSYIPIETLSVVYEQFLHLRQTASGVSAGKKQGAYYTPIPVVNFMIDRMDELKPLRPGMRVLDPSCGSGAFLVQCYRKLIEDSLRSTPNAQKLRPTELRELLVRHIFGMDVDAEACRVAELSLLLTMLDYIDPPDLTTTTFKLPDLSGTNIVEANAFDDTNDFVAKAKTTRFDWIVGNPPWNELKGSTTDAIDEPVLKWMLAHKKDKPTGGNQTAEAFAWRTQDFAAEGAPVALLVPAMVLFKDESRGFRQSFFAANRPAYVANFANLAEVLFARRSRVPAAALIFWAGRNATQRKRHACVPVFSPLVANQEPTRPRTQGARVDSWTIVIDESEFRAVDIRDIESGDALVWKMAAWGSDLDRSILRRTAALPQLRTLAGRLKLTISEGMQLRPRPKPGGESVEHHKELAERLTLDVAALTGLRRIFAFPPQALSQISRERTYVRAGRFTLPNRVSQPPHVLVSAARNWAVFSDEYLVVPARQIGIVADRGQALLLKALTLYLNSDFVQYHQFLVSTEAGVKRPRSTLEALRSLPIPRSLMEADKDVVGSWAALHDQLAAHDRQADLVTDAGARDAQKAAILSKVNALVNKSLGLGGQDSVRVFDFVNVLFGLCDGKVEDRAVRAPDASELQVYAERLQHELNVFVGPDAGARHSITVRRNGHHGVVQVDLQARNAAVTVHAVEHGSGVAADAAELRQQLETRFAQWRYFNRNLRLFAENRLYLFKPLQLFHWLESKAILDAAEVIGLVLDHAPRPS